MKKLDNDHYEVVTAGHSKHDKMYFDARVWQSGGIVDGIALKHEGQEGYWLIAYSDLLEMAEIARKRRER